MKYLILFTIILVHSTSAFAVDVTATETALNQTLLNNGAAAKNLEASKASAPVSIKILNNGGSSTTKTSSSNLSDQEKQLSENFVDQAGSNKIIKEKCTGEMQQACNGLEVDHKIMGMKPVMVKVIAQAYASFGAMSDSFLPLSAGVVKPKIDAPVDDSKAKEKPMDYCKYIPAATEAIAVFSQANTVKNLNNGGETSQKEQLLKAAKSHDGRAEQAQIQAVGWYGGAACYAVNAGLGNFAIDKNLVIKMAAATFLGTVYQSEVANNKDYAQKTRDIASSLPSKGNCNPVTENECYCSTPEYENDPVYCKAQIAKKNAASSFTRVACTDDHLKIDAACACEKTNTCFDKFLENHGAAELQIGMGYSNSPFKSVASLAKGKLEGGTLNSNSYSGSAAIAKKALSEFMSKIPENNNPLSLNQKAVADTLATQGIPASVSRLMAQNSPPQSAIDSSITKASSLSLGRPYQMASFASNNSVVDFSGGNGLGTSGKKNEKKSGVEDFLGKLNPPKGSPINNSKILEFAQKAQAQAAQITKSDKPIFEIISLRYQSSGRRLLELDSNN